MMKKLMYLTIIIGITSCRCLETANYRNQIRFFPSSIFENYNVLFISSTQNDTIRLDTNNYFFREEKFTVNCKENKDKSVEMDYKIYEVSYFNQFHFKTHYEDMGKNEYKKEKIQYNGKTYDIYPINFLVNMMGDTIKNVSYIQTENQDTLWFSLSGLIQFNEKNMGKYYLSIQNK